MGSQGLLDIFQAGIPEKVRKQIGQWQEDGQSVVFYGQETRLLAVLAISDRIKPTSAEAVKELKKQGIEVHLLTGDGVRTAERVAATLDIGYYKAEVMPNDKEEYIISLQQQGKKVAMVGDGINDSASACTGRVASRWEKELILQGCGYGYAYHVRPVAASRCDPFVQTDSPPDLSELVLGIYI